MTSEEVFDLIHQRDELQSRYARLATAARAFVEKWEASSRAWGVDPGADEQTSFSVEFRALRAELGDTE